MSNSSTEFYVGIDLGNKRHRVCILDAAGDVIDREWVGNTAKELVEFCHRFTSPATVQLALETGTHSPWISHLLAASGFSVLVSHARKVRAIWDAERKDDDRDAEKLARLLRFDPTLLHPIRHRDRSCQVDLLTIKARNALVESRSKLVNSVRGLLKSSGVDVPSCSTEGFPKQVRECDCEEAVRASLLPVLEVVEALTSQIRGYDRKIASMCRDTYPETARLMQVRGVGPVTALAFILTLDDPTRFAKSRDVGPYLGLVPKRDQSGDQDKPLRISKAGNIYLRRLLVGSANYILGPFGEDCDLRRHGERIAGDRGQVAKRKAKVAVARKLAVLLHRLWVSGETYEPLRRSAPKTVAA